MGLEARVFLRLTCGFRVHFLKNSAGGSPSPARGCDISTNGLGFITRQPLQNGDQISLIFSLPGQWKKIRIESIVRRQAPQNSGLLFTGVQFLDPDETSLKEISNYITRATHFTGSRWLTVLLCVILSGFSFLRYGVIDFAIYFSKTEAGSIFSLFSKNQTLWVLYLYSHLALGAALILSAAGVFFFRPLARKCLLAIAFLGTAAQLYRLIQKISFLNSGSDRASIYFFEGLQGLMFAGLLILMIQLGLSRRFDSYLSNLSSYIQKH